MLDTEGFDALPHRARRARVAERLGDTAALVPAGAAPPRNYAANTYDFRAGSHFLYLVGQPIEEAMALLDGDRCTVFVPPTDPEGALWHGPQPGIGSLADALGCEVRTLDALPAALRETPRVATVPAIDAATRSRQAEILGRAVDPAHPTDADARLADALVATRLVHDEAAVAGLREAARATAAAHAAGMAATRPGIREWEVVAAMRHALAQHGAGTAYPPIVTVHGEVLHNHAHHHLLRDGDLMLADVGAESRGGWAGDVTRTWPVSGRFSPTQRDAYEAVLAAQAAAIDAVRPGARYRDVHLTAARTLAAALVDLGVLYGPADDRVEDGCIFLFFPHGVGHLIGLDVHDMEDLGDRAGYAPGRTRSDRFGLKFLRLDRDLVPGMAVTIEPGFYQVPAILAHRELIEGVRDRIDWDGLRRFGDVRGIRIEDDVLVTADGAEVLTRAIPKRPADVEAAVGGG